VPVDFELYLPESWAEDPKQRRECHIPEHGGGGEATREASLVAKGADILGSERALAYGLGNGPSRTSSGRGSMDIHSDCDMDHDLHTSPVDRLHHACVAGSAHSWKCRWPTNQEHRSDE
jgi:hypothetical protein